MADRRLAVIAGFPAGRTFSYRSGFCLLFRRLFLESLEKAFDVGKLQLFSTLEPLHKRPAFTRHLANLEERDWVVYAKAPFAGPEQVLDYVGRYTHRVAISNNRLLDIENDQVRFKWKD